MIIRPSAPPLGVRTIPVRSRTVRMPASVDGAVAASQSTQTSERNSEGCGGPEASVSTSSPLLPYQPIAEAESSTRGGCDIAATERAISEVPRALLLRIRSFCSGLQRFSPMPSPARCTTASTPSSAPASIVPAIGSQTTLPGTATPPRTNLRTRCPSASRAAIRADPIKPLAPVTAISTGRSFNNLGGLRCSLVPRLEPKALPRASLPARAASSTG